MKTSLVTAIVSFVLTASVASQGALELPPLPFGSAATPDGALLFRVNPGDATVSVIDIVPTSATFLRQVAEIGVGRAPRGIAAAPDGTDVHVVNSGDDSISIIDVGTLTVRKTITSPLLDRPVDVALGPREDGTSDVAFGSGTYHGYVVNANGTSALVYQSGPDGVAGLGFDDLIGEVAPGAAPFLAIIDAQAVLLDPEAPLDAFGDTVGCYVAHRGPNGQGMVSRIAYTRDDQPGPDLVDTTVVSPGFGAQTFEVTQQYVSTHVGAALDVAVADDALSVAHPVRVYLSMEGGVVDVFDAASGAFVRRFEPGYEVPDLNLFLQP